MDAPLRALDFFAGSGLVTVGLDPLFQVVWANDICPKKEKVYKANFPTHEFRAAPIQILQGADLPAADLGWASFPCQDLSLAGNLEGLEHGRRSSLFFEWLRVLDEMVDEKRPPVLCAENVVGFLVADQGRQFRLAYEQLRRRGYFAGAIVLDAIDFVPQSRPRSFLIAMRKDVPVGDFDAVLPDPKFHTNAVMKSHAAVRDPDWIWWKLPKPPSRQTVLADLCDFTAPCDPPDVTTRRLGMLSELNQHKLELARKSGTAVGTGYNRIRQENGVKKQRLEIRFDGVAGCLRTPNGGSSRQVVLLVDGEQTRTRLLTPREAARLMGAPDSFKLPGNYNEAYWAMGDAVAAPVTRWLAEHLLAPLAEKTRQVAHAQAHVEIHRCA